jgi:hypothetical protein
LYNPVPREQIADALIHLRGLFREISPSSEKDYRAQERREILSKNLLSNLFRTKEHPTLNVVFEVADAFSLTLDGAHRLFGYELERIREYDLKLNAGRTHNPKLDLSLAVFTRLLSIHILRLLTGTCNGHEHRLPLRSSHASLLEPARRMGNLDAKNRNCTEESGRTSVDTESLSCGAALLWGVLDRDRATMAHQGSFDGGVMVTREFWSEFSRTVFRIRR